ncbi:MAG: hypothetical protein R3B70_43885 [Polyangiaceae bacterium]
MSRSTRVRRQSFVGLSVSFSRAGLVALACSSTMLLAAACDAGETSSGTAGQGGTGGGGGTGGCLRVPGPTFALRVLEESGGPVPPGTVIEVHWSAGDEPPFKLDQPSTWGTLETSNLVCDVDPSLPPPEDLAMLECVLWTSSPTEVTVSAKGYITEQHTFTADPSTECNPDPTPIEVELAAEAP